MSTTTTTRKCVDGCRCGRHRKRTLAERYAISNALKRRTESDPAWREHLSRIATERWERERAAAMHNGVLGGNTDGGTT